jgi:hypothetical protein|tara:strand:+ start:1240 stop:1806 length:567 start_codon:yes stop_codon:yes gene_type:complete
MRLFIAVYLCTIAASAYAQGVNTITSTVTGTTTVDRTPPTASAPNIVLNNQDVCSFPASAALQTQIFGFAAGTTIRDKNCERIKLARSLYFMGMKVAGVSLLCQDKRVFEAMEMAGTPCPYEGKIGRESLVLWEVNENRRPDKKEYRKRKKDKPSADDDDDADPKGWVRGPGGSAVYCRELGGRKQCD